VKWSSDDESKLRKYEAMFIGHGDKKFGENDLMLPLILYRSLEL
jgi:hypothetical protein